MAPDLPRNRYRTPWRAKASRTSSAWRYSNMPILDSMVSQPARQIRFAPAAIGFHRVEGTKPRIVHHGLVRLDERVLPTLRQRPPRRRLELGQPLGRNSL